jgi:hypothetical protein
MTVPPPSVRTEPAIDAWSPARAAHDRSELVARVNARAQRLGTAALDARDGPLIATGHQAQLWHPGILAKDIAMDLAAERLGAARLHVVVDQDTNEAWRLQVPRLDGDALRVRSVMLPQTSGVPTGFQAPADPGLLLEQLAGDDPSLIRPLTEAVRDLPACGSRAEQIAVVLARLKKPYAGDVPVMLVSDLAGLPAFESVVGRMLGDVRACAAAYNKACAALPEAGMSPLIESRDFVELPLWAAAWDAPRRRVFVDLADTEPMFVFDDGEPIDRSAVTLLPRALLLTAVMRSTLCDLFVHGTGGLVYDRVTEVWWQDWTGGSLAPIAGVTADVYLDLGAPVADRAAVDRAVWRRHHLPHNLDRVLGLTGAPVHEKRELLAYMDDDRDRARRRRAFNRLHEINRDLAGSHRDALAAADRELDLARVGLSNALTAKRRDWCFALYPPDALKGLRRVLAGHPVQCPA